MRKSQTWPSPWATRMWIKFVLLTGFQLPCSHRPAGAVIPLQLTESKTCRRKHDCCTPPISKSGCCRAIFTVNTFPRGETQGSTEEGIRNWNDNCNILSFKKQTRASPALTTRSWQCPVCMAQTRPLLKPETGTQIPVCTAAPADTNCTCSYMSNNYLFI